MTLLVRDEEDIVASNIEFHLQNGVDFIIATDNLSVNGTADILRRYQRSGLLHYLYQPNDDYAQGRWVTEMARLACTEFHADWVINGDADEFWYPSHGDLKQVLESIPPSCQAAAVNRVNLVARDHEESGFFADRMCVRECHSRNVFGTPLPGKVCHRAWADIEVEQGNHKVRRGGTLLDPAPCDAEILHFPIRSFGQFVNKIAKGGAAYERNTSVAPEIGGTWRHLYEVYKAGEMETWWRRAIPDRQTIEAGLRDGTLVCDYRLRDFFMLQRSGGEARS